MIRDRLAAALQHVGLGALVTNPFICVPPDLLPPVGRPWSPERIREDDGPGPVVEADR